MKNNVIAALTMAAIVLSQATVAVANHISVSTVGTPNWSIVDYQLFSAPADSQATFNGVFASLVPDDLPTHTPHGPPYGSELSDNVALNGYADNQTIYVPAEIDGAPNGVYFARMIIPDPGVTGPSRDFASGPVIPPGRFPITIDSELFRNNNLVESSCCDASINNTVNTSHSPVVTALFQPWEFDPAGVFGDYELREEVRDVQGNGFDVAVRFTVVPEPATCASILVLIGILAARRVRIT